MEELLYPVPKALGIRNWAEGLTVCMLDEPVRIGMMYVTKEAFHLSNSAAECTINSWMQATGSAVVQTLHHLEHPQICRLCAEVVHATSLRQEL